jgi:hypothetical protein
VRLQHGLRKVCVCLVVNAAPHHAVKIVVAAILPVVILGRAIDVVFCLGLTFSAIVETVTMQPTVLPCQLFTTASAATPRLPCWPLPPLLHPCVWLLLFTSWVWSVEMHG